LDALLDACVEGRIVFTEPVREYAARAKAMKAAFLVNGFRLVYDNEFGEPLAYGDMHCTKLSRSSPPTGSARASP